MANKNTTHTRSEYTKWRQIVNQGMNEEILLKSERIIKSTRNNTNNITTIQIIPKEQWMEYQYTVTTRRHKYD